ncbi:hypothetical protein LINPERPRIM_LOCUS38460 [Linum perenne]
MGGLSLDVAFC